MADRPDFTPSPRKPQFGGWWHINNIQNSSTLAVLRRIWAVEPRGVSPQCWKWLTAYGPPRQGEQK